MEMEIVLVLCGVGYLCLAALLAYVFGRWIPSLGGTDVVNTALAALFWPIVVVVAIFHVPWVLVEYLAKRGIEDRVSPHPTTDSGRE